MGVVFYHSIIHHPGHVTMVLRQHSQVVWATTIVFKLLWLWLRHTLLLLLIITHLLVEALDANSLC